MFTNKHMMILENSIWVRLLFFLAQKLWTTCYIRCFSIWCTFIIFWPSEIPCCVDTCVTERCWWYSEASEIAVYHAENKLRGAFGQCSPAVKNTLFPAYSMPIHACQLWSKYTQTKCLRAAYVMPSQLCIIYPEMQVFAHTKLVIVSRLLMLIEK